MSHEATLFVALGGLVANRCYPHSFPQSPALPTWPAIRYTIVGGVVYKANEGNTGTDDVRVQVDIVAASYDQAAALSTQVRTALEALDYPAVLNTAPAYSFDPETKTHRYLQDWQLCPSE